MLSLSEKLLFLVLTAASLAYAFIGFQNVYRVIARGSGERPSAETLRRRAREALITWVTTRPIWKARPATSLFHGLIAWGFMFYFLVNFGDLLEGFFPIAFLGKGWLGGFYRFLADLFSAGVLVGMIYFLARRFLFRSPALRYRENIRLLPAVQEGAIARDSLIVGLFILFHVGFRLLAASFAVAAEGGDWGQPFAHLLSLAWQGWSEGALTAGHRFGWWGALGLILLFVPYFPYTKHFHLVMAGVNYLTKPQRTSLGALDPIDFEDETVESFGVARIEELPWTHLVDAYACIMCNRCQDVCPAYATGKELSPAALEVNKRLYLNAHLEELAAGQSSEFSLLDFAISESAVWACTACGACVEICPVGNEPMFDILYLRRHQVLMESQFPRQLQNAFRGMERNGNPWNQSAAERLAWAEGLNVPTIDENPEPEILWWVGCAPAYDPRARETARALAQVLQAAGVNFAVLGEQESCTGDAARRAGNEYLFYEMALANIETLNAVQPKRIVTTCPHCLHTLGKEYPQYGGHYEVIHHTQLLSELAAAGKIQVQANGSTDTITFHDPCYLGRHNGIVAPPRQVLQELGLQVVEMPRHGAHSFCCGAGGAQMWKEEEHGDEAVNVHRYREAESTGAGTLAVGCPFCLTMLTDASRKTDNALAVKDIAELVAERLS
ncbi:(Fe-S)-binding protein [Litorilinea aerophila]|uniref:(Fe-S)-binding protein n=1 Tax=Litorilinea aerophila TaxID=1204385 RepID=A0A540VH81_9CHLR|nr:(Fe-S)-binding protein [Litorilinea aerophila]MCC9076170.1 (Fe-S)-binding protein [Litorilinea aerophila]